MTFGRRGNTQATNEEMLAANPISLPTRLVAPEPASESLRHVQIFFLKITTETTTDKKNQKPKNKNKKNPKKQISRLQEGKEIFHYSGGGEHKMGIF